MSMKEVLKLAGIVLLITPASVVVSVCLHYYAFKPENLTMELPFFEQVVLLSLLAAALSFVFYSPRDYGAVAMRLRMLLHFALLAGSVLGFTLRWRWILPRADHIILLVVCLLAVYLGVIGLLFLDNKRTAERLDAVIKRNKKRP